MRTTSMANFGFNGIGNNYSRIKEITVNQPASDNKLLALANKIKKISNTAIAFIKKKLETLQRVLDSHQCLLE